MSRRLGLLFGILALVFGGCDNESNVKPRNEDFFIKFYAGLKPGNQFGSDIIKTSDGGLLLTGWSENNDLSKELILIKTDSKGDQEWIFDSSLENSVGTSVIEIPGEGYVVGGTKTDTDNIDRAFLIKVDLDGNLIVGPETIYTTEINGTKHSNELKKITLGKSGKILVSGNTTHPSGSFGGVNMFIKLYNTNLQLEIVSGVDAIYLGEEGNDYTAGAYEVADTLPVNNGLNIRYIVFGYTAKNNSQDFRSFSVTDQFKQVDDNVVALPLNQIAYNVTRDGDQYWVIGTSGNAKTILAGFEFRIADPINKKVFYTPSGDGDEIKTDIADDVVGKGVAVQANGDLVIVSDVIYKIDEYSEIFLARVSHLNRNVESPWPKLFGTTSATYTASTVTVLDDGSIVVLGTADLLPIKKIMVLKTGPDGQMSF